MKIADTLHAVVMLNLEQARTPTQRAEALKWKGIIDRNSSVKSGKIAKPRRTHGRKA